MTRNGRQFGCTQALHFADWRFNKPALTNGRHPTEDHVAIVLLCMVNIGRNVVRKLRLISIESPSSPTSSTKDVMLTYCRLVELTSRHRQEVELESERAKQSQGQLEKTQIARERAHKQRVKGLEEQVSTHFHLCDCSPKGSVYLFIISLS